MAHESTSAVPLPRLGASGLSAPIASDIVSSLRTVVHERAEGVWGEVCESAGIRRGALLLELDKLDAATAALMAMPGEVSLVGRAYAIRTATYRALSASTDDAPARMPDWTRTAMEQLLKNRLSQGERLTALSELDLFNEETRALLDRAATRFADRLGAPIGLVSLVLDGAQQFGGTHGLDGWMADVDGTPVEWSFCATTVRTREPYVIADATADVVQRTNPIVVVDGVRSYAGVPLITADGVVLGACCVLSDQPRDYAEADIAELGRLAAALMAELEARALPS